MADWQPLFLLGALGAIAPEVVRQVNVLRNGGTYTWSPSLIFFSLVYAAIAGVVAAILPSANLYSAFYNGISTDVLIGKAHAAAAGNRRRKTSQTKEAGAEAAPARLSPYHSFLDAL
ncbi:hypothetical protein [Bradyrhizobium amphicarpaeae]|uniref:Uncharacterized protein n=1 Tax=Bradyrhizobium amphicarpaeae TaxID=1404768 RepID=A0A2U8PUC7_9BRAD|nr:hypothetical protein [Bradyrhizobium amphicarpaeae]AWM01344.1 hypothetical protein CIT40_15740 [Bradyrhizobium amphicarpaeae]